MSNLTEVLQPETVHTPMKDDQVSFFTKNSPLSNFYSSPFTYQGDKFTCMEQHIQAKKAALFKDAETGINIMAETKQEIQKQLSKNINGYDQTEWYSKAFDLILPALIEKYRQNPVCKTLLLSTGNRAIVEASPYDSFWGAGCALSDPKLWSKEWDGRNMMGKALEKVRESLK